MAYTLYNKLNKQTLVHPSVGLWYTNSVEEALSMYEACLEYLDACDLTEMIPHMSIVDADTLEDINLLTASRTSSHNI